MVSLLFTSGCQAALTAVRPPVLGHNPGNVLYVSTNGNDLLARRGIVSAPWRNVDAAISNSVPGDKIVVGSGNFTNSLASPTIFLPDRVDIFGTGTNSTKVYASGLMRMYGHSELSGFTWTSQEFRIETNSCYLHDLVVNSGAYCVFVADNGPGGWNVFSNCLFSPLNIGVGGNGTNFFYNCRVVKDPAAAQGGDPLVQVQGVTYFSGGSISSFTNDSCIYNLNAPHPLFAFLQNCTLTTGSGGYQINGDAANSNYVFNVTFTLTNSTAKVMPFSGFPNTNTITPKWGPTWPSPTTNRPPVRTPPHAQ